MIIRHMSVSQNGSVDFCSQQGVVHRVSPDRGTLPNNGLQRTALRAAAEAERYAASRVNEPQS